MGEVRIHVERLHLSRSRLGCTRGLHEWCVRATRGGEPLSSLPSYGTDLRACVRRTVARARAQLLAERLGMLGWPAVEP